MFVSCAVKMAFGAVIFALLLSSGCGSDLEELLEADGEFGSVYSSSKRVARQAGFVVACVPTSTCLSTAPNGTTTIDPRIVIPGGTVTPPITTVCPPGQVACTGLASATACGQRYTSNINTQSGLASYGAFPWQAFIMNQSGYTGAGVLLDSMHVLTAAHKVNLNIATPGNVIVYMGVYNPNDKSLAQVRTAQRIMIHERFVDNYLINDIAIIRLNASINLGYQNNIGVACLPAAGSSYINQNNCVVSGWGKTSFTANDAPNAQKQVQVRIVDYNTCRASMMQPNVLGSATDQYLDQNGELCAGGVNQQDACTQDGGSPLVCPDASGRFYVAGLVIWGKNCGQPGVYGVYVDVAKYRNWIDTNIAQLNAG